MGGTKDILNLKYIEAADSSTNQGSPLISLEYPHDSICLQFRWQAGVAGVFTFQASLFNDQWETLVGCEELKVTVDTGKAGSELVSIPGSWMVTRNLRFIWTPDEGGSSGTYDVALRIVPR